MRRDSSGSYRKFERIVSEMNVSEMTRIMGKRGSQMRNKLIDLVKPFVSGGACDEESGLCELTTCRDFNAQALAGRLLENGVTMPLYSVGDKVWYCDKNIDVITTAVIEKLCNKKPTYSYLIKTNYGVLYHVNEDQLYSTLVETEEDLKGVLKNG